MNSVPVKHVSPVVIWYKLVSGTLELLLGLGMLFVRRPMYRLYTQFVTAELLEDSHEQVAAVLMSIIPFVRQHRIYLTFLLLTLGLVKIIGAIGLLRRKEWGLDLLVGLFALLLPFDLYNLFVHPTPVKIGYLLINLFIVLYLIEFKPHIYARRVQNAIRRKREAYRR